jgi:hypothetical protein
MLGDAAGGIGADSGAACVGAGFGVAPFRHLSSTQGVAARCVVGDPRKTLSQKLLCALAIVGHSNKAKASAAPVPIRPRFIAGPKRKAARTGRPPDPILQEFCALRRDAAQ